MPTSRLPLAVLLAASLLAGCARRNKAAIPVASTPVAPAPVVAPTAARDLTDVLTEELNLTTDQRAKVRAVFTSTTEQANSAKQRLGANRPALLAELKRINASSEQELKGILTPAQYQQLKTKQRQVQAQMQARKAGGEK
jgi:Spy/CpxP family protein refolding chaperone